jgi:PAS domain S-box-containing protein
MNPPLPKDPLVVGTPQEDCRSGIEAELLRSMFEQAPLPLMIVDLEGRISWANRGCQNFIGFEESELRDARLQDLCVPYERNRYVFLNLGRLAGSTEMDIDLRRKDGGSFMASVSFSPFHHRGRPYLLLVLRDVTTKRVLEGQIREREERYRKLHAERDSLENQLIRSSKLACLGEIAGGIAHEINNPLGIILGFAQDILEEMSPKDPLHESIRIIEQETARCVEVVRSLLDYARLKPPQIADADLPQLLDDCLSLLKPRIKKNKIRVRRNFEEGLPAIQIDSHLMQQAILNIMINSIQAMPHGGDLIVSAGVTRHPQHGEEGSRVCITVTDTGHGIPTEHLGRIFDPFFSTKGSKGTGLGLSVCQRIVEDHSGKVEVEKCKTSGTTCRVFLPV